MAMTREKDYKIAVSQIANKIIRNSMPEPKMLSVEFCSDIPNMEYTFAWSYDKCASGLQNQYIKNLGLTKCKREEATAYIIIGERPEGMEWNGMWKARANKSYWLKPL